jgi:hypothetical protein
MVVKSEGKEMKRLFLLVLLVSMFFVLGCSVEPSKVKDGHAKKMAQKITYFKDHRTGLCYGVIATRKTMRTSQSGMGMTTVPCEQVEKVLVN